MIIRISLLARLAFSLVLALPLLAHGLTVKDIDIPERVRNEDLPELVLNGAAVRQKYFVVDIYVGALYLERTNQDPQAILQDPGYKRMAFYLLRDVRGRVVADAIYEGMQLNMSKEETEAMEKELRDFVRIFDHKIKRGEVATLDYIPGQGTRLRIAGKDKGIIPGKRLYDAILSIWIGEQPVSEGFKAAILGLAPAEVPAAEPQGKKANAALARRERDASF